MTKSLKDAQIEYELMMKEKPSFHVDKEFESDLFKSINGPEMIKGGRGSHDAPEMVAQSIRESLSGMSVKSIQMSSEDTEVGTGLYTTKDVNQIILTVVDIARSSMCDSMIEEFKQDTEISAIISSLADEEVSILTSKDFGFEIERGKDGYILKLPDDKNELIVFNRKLNNYLRKNNVVSLSRDNAMHRISRGVGKVVATRNRLAINRASKKVKLSNLDKKMINLSKKIQPALQMNEHKQFRMTRLAFSKWNQNVRQIDLGEGSVFSISLVKNTYTTIRTTLMAYMSSRYALDWARKKSQTLAIHASNSKLAKEINEQISKNSFLKQKKDHFVKTSKVRNKKHIRKRKEKHLKSARRAERFGKLKKRILDPFSLRSKAGVIFRKSKLGKVAGKVFRPLTIAKALTGKVIAFVMTIASAALSFIMIAAVGLVIVVLIASLLTSILTSIVALFDFSTTSDEMVDVIFNTIEECYEEQNNEIMRLRNKYNNTTISYVDYKDESVYEDEKHLPLNEFNQTTNSVEMMCMAIVYFDYDLEGAGENKVKDYIKKLYNGSHTTTINEHKYTVVDDEGIEHIYIDADITLTTYYYGSIFESNLSSSYGVLAGTEISEQVWNYLRSVGFTEECAAAVMGNIYQESLMDPTKTGMNVAGGLCMWETLWGPANGSFNWGDLYARAVAQNVPWTDLKLQLDFLMDSMPYQFRLYTGNGVHTYSTGALAWWPDPITVEEYKKLTDIELATEIFSRVFERPSIPRMERRISFAKSYYEMYKGTEVIN